MTSQASKINANIISYRIELKIFKNAGTPPYISLSIRASGIVILIPTQLSTYLQSDQLYAVPMQTARDRLTFEELLKYVNQPVRVIRVYLSDPSHPILRIRF